MGSMIEPLSAIIGKDMLPPCYQTGRIILRLD